MKKFVLFLLIAMFSMSLFGNIVKQNDAEKVAKSFYYQHVQHYQQLAWDDIRLTPIMKPEDGICPFYVFNVNENEGFIIISSLDIVQPVLAYSFEGPFNYDNMSPGQTTFINYYSLVLNRLIQNPEPAKDGVNAEWESLLSYNPSMGLQKETTVGPFILAEWNQDWPFNADCPTDTDCTAPGANGHVYVGCVATAMVHVMKYYNWPPSGEGSKTHLSWVNGGYGNRTVNFAQQTYNWYSMTNSVSGENSEIAKICYHAGVAVAMYWGCDGSGSQTSNIASAMKNYFKYSTSIQYVEKSDYTDTNWKNLLRTQLDATKPMVYSGSPSSGAGHAWNCDGYQGTTHFHMNWGWGGAGNGFYTLENLTSSATPGGDEYNFIYGQEAIINIYPRETYPLYCDQNINLTTPVGAFGDGSANLDYQNNHQCTYVIAPACGEIVQLKFESFDLGTGDVVRLYNGENTSSPLLQTFTSAAGPGTSMFVADKGAMCIEFVTDGSDTGTGWDVSYSVKNCKTNIIYSEPEGSINDGSGTCDYSNSTMCSWFIQPAGATWISIDFTEFNLAGSIDYVKVYKNATGTANLVATFNSTTPPTEDVIVESGVAVIQFFADANNVGTGWTIDYTSSLVGIESESLKPITHIYPNPSDGNAVINYYTQGTTQATFTISDITGKTIYKTSLSSENSIFNLPFGEVIGSSLSDGMYFLDIESEGIRTTEKIIISR